MVRFLWVIAAYMRPMIHTIRQSLIGFCVIGPLKVFLLTCHFWTFEGNSFWGFCMKSWQNLQERGEKVIISFFFFYPKIWSQTVSRRPLCIYDDRLDSLHWLYFTLIRFLSQSKSLSQSPRFCKNSPRAAEWLTLCDWEQISDFLVSALFLIKSLLDFSGMPSGLCWNIDGLVFFELVTPRCQFCFHFLPLLTEESTWRMRCPLTFPPQPSYESFLWSHAASENAAEGFATWLMESGGSADEEKQRRWHTFVNLRDWQWKKCFSQWCALTIFDEWATTSWPKQGCNRTAEFQTSPVSKRSDIIICWDAKKYQLSQPSSSSNKFEAEGTLAVRGGIAKFL